MISGLFVKREESSVMATLSPEHHKFPRWNWRKCCNSGARSRSELVKKLEVWTVDSEGIYREYERLQVWCTL